MKQNIKLSSLFAVGLGFLLCGLATRTNAQTPMPPVTPNATPTAKTDTALPAPPQIDKQAMALLKRNQQAMFALKTYVVECHTTRIRPKASPGLSRFEYEIATLTAQKPNKMRYDKWDLSESNETSANWTKPAQQPANAVYRCDGVTFYQQIGSIYRASKLVAPKYIRTLLEPWDGFYAVENSPLGEVEQAHKENGLRTVRSDGREDVGGVMCDKVFIEHETSYAGIPMNCKITWYFGPDGLTRRCVNRLDVNSDTGFTDDSVLVNLHLNAPIDAAQYAYTPAKGAKLYVDGPTVPLLANGTPAPDILGQDRDNKPVKLSSLRGKVVVVDFWASWCLPCNAAMPHNQAVIKKLQTEGLPVVMLAVDNADTRAVFDSWIKRQSKELNALQFVFVPASEPVSRQYRAAVIPTQYVLDKDGVIRASFSGYEGPTDTLEKAVRDALAAETGKPLSADKKKVSILEGSKFTVKADHLLQLRK